MGCCNKSCVAIGAGVTLSLAGVIVLVICTAFQNVKPATTLASSEPCADVFGPITYLHRGNLSAAQENTYASVVSGTGAAAVEFDVSSASDGTVLFHDTSMKRMTGGEKNINDITLTEALATPILPEIDGHTYGGLERIPTMEEVVIGLCAKNPSGGFDFDIKSATAGTDSIKALNSSNCTDTAETVIFATGLPNVANSLKSTLAEYQMSNRISVFLHPGAYGPIGLYFFLKTRVFHTWLSGASIISLHKTVWAEEKELIQDWKDAGWCTAVYGINASEVGAYDASYYVVDEGPTFPDVPGGGFGGDAPVEETSYSASRSGYIGILSLGVILLVVGLLLIFYGCKSSKVKMVA